MLLWWLKYDSLIVTMLFTFDACVWIRAYLPFDTFMVLPGHVHNLISQQYLVLQPVKDNSKS